MDTFLSKKLDLTPVRAMPLEGTLMDLAAEIGLTHEALYRTLANLEKAGVIRRTRSGIALRKAAST